MVYRNAVYRIMAARLAVLFVVGHLLLTPLCEALYCSTEGELRLVGGQNRFEGRVEICHNSQWGTVCDDRWGTNDAKVVCRQLGLPSSGATAYSRAYFGEGSGQIWLDEVHCGGFESRLDFCSASTFGVNDCTHAEDAGVKCESCSYTQWQCDNGQCISSSQRCDGDWECTDLSDERNCPTQHPTCDTYEWQCNNGFECVYTFDHCDGVSDCSDGSDEMNCGCSSSQWQCDSGQCIQSFQRCDGDSECGDGSDEYNCYSGPGQNIGAIAGGCIGGFLTFVFLPLALLFCAAKLRRSALSRTQQYSRMQQFPSPAGTQGTTVVASRSSSSRANRTSTAMTQSLSFQFQHNNVHGGTTLAAPPGSQYVPESAELISDPPPPYTEFEVPRNNASTSEPLNAGRILENTAVLLRQFQHNNNAHGTTTQPTEHAQSVAEIPTEVPPPYTVSSEPDEIHDVDFNHGDDGMEVDGMEVDETVPLMFGSGEGGGHQIELEALPPNSQGVTAAQPGGQRSNSETV